MSRRRDANQNPRAINWRRLPRDVIKAEADAAQRKLDMLERGETHQEHRGCTGKVSYLSRGMAKDAARKLVGLAARKLTEYKCPHCSLFHLTSVENSFRLRGAK